MHKYYITGFQKADRDGLQRQAALVQICPAAMKAAGELEGDSSEIKKN